MTSTSNPLALALLAGGLATRLRPVTERLPKSLVDVNGEPFIAHQLRLLQAGGIRRVVVCAGHLGEQIMAAVGTGGQFGLEVTFAFDGARLLGTAGALRRALPMLDEPFFVMYGDSYLPCDYAAIQDAFSKASVAALMTVFRNDDKIDRSNVELADGKLIAYDKRKPTPNMRHIDYGLGVLTREAVVGVPAGRPSDLADLYRDLLARGDLIGYEVAERFYEIGSPAGLAELRTHLAAQAGHTRPSATA